MTKTTFILLLTIACAACSTSAPELVSGIDFDGFDSTVRPQDDFNRYVNGRWIDTTEIPSDQSGWGAIQILRQASDENQRAIIEEAAARTDLVPGSDEQLIGDFFGSYMDTDRLEELGAEPVRDELDAVLAAQSLDELLAISARQRREGVGGSPIGFYVDQDLKDSSTYTIYLVQSGLTLPDRDYYLRDDAELVKIREALPGHAQTLFELAGIGNAEARGRAVLAVESKLAEYHWPAADTRDVEKIYNPYATADLPGLTANIDWPAYLEAAGVGGREQVIVGMPSYIEGLGSLARQIPLEDWKSYFAFRVLNARADILSDAFVQADFNFHGKLVSGLEEIQPRWRRGAQMLDGLIGEAVGKLYVERHFPPEAKARMEALVQNLVATFGDAIQELDWMTPETKARAQQKREKFTYKIGYPDKWRDYSSITARRDDLMGNVRQAAAFEYDRNLRKLDNPVDRAEWFMTPQTVNAYYNTNLNEIVFPAAILQPPFFNMDADDAVNYGGIGAVIGHEIGHAFDDQGRNFDGDGNMQSWWQDADDTAFRSRAERLVDHYGRFEPVQGVNVNGRLTLGENIGDLTGVTIAYRAYMKSLNGAPPPVMDDFTAAQRFFIGYAQIWRSKIRDESMRARLLSDPHSPPAVRVNGTLPHVPMFYEAFNLERGDGMWLPPDQRVKIW